MDYKGAEKYIIDKLRDELPDNLYYHGLEHTLDVLKSAENYAAMEHLCKEDLILLKTAALYHDSGFLVKYSSNEVDSVDIICSVLPRYDYSIKQIDRIGRMILSTEIPQKPKNLLEKILCDADLDYLGRDDFYMIAIRLFREWNANGITTSLKEWYMQELYFLQQHEYFTKSAILLRNEKKKIYIAQVKELVGNNI
jgi:uncharacterized protein